MSAAHPPDHSPIQVAAAVMLSRDRESFLLACRPPGKIYAGYWEFPGGKVEAGETARAALTREIREELGVVVTQATPWLCRDFVYPHAHVRLHFWRVTGWEGEIGVTAPLEHSAVVWQALRGPQQVAPMLPANAPILKALSLPWRMGITQAEQNGVHAELNRLREAIHAGLRLIQLRDRHLSGDLRRQFAEAVMTLARPHDALVLVSEDGAGAGAQLARHIGAHGLHLTSRTLGMCATRPDFSWVGASCHDKEELEIAARLELDYVLLGPVLPTPSHPQARPLGWEAFAQRLENYSLPVFALGGQGEDTLEAAQSCGAHGIASLRNW
jgi:8-oxo-dGTP diphosphatase